MATFTDARKLAAHQRARARRLQYGYTSIDAASREAAEIAREEAERLTSGPRRTARDLRRAGHPFRRNRLRAIGRRGGGGLSLMAAWPLLPIGRQSGRLRRSFRIFRRGDGVWRMQNIAPHSPAVLAPGGTKNMVRRGFWEELNRRTIRKVRQKRLELWRAGLKG